MEYLASTTETLIFDIWIFFNETLMCIVMDGKSNLLSAKLKIHNMMYRNVYLNTSPKISHNFQGIHHYILNI